MAYYNQNYNYPKNWNCNGLGWINPAAFAQSPPANQWPTVPSPSSSGYSSLNRDGSSISGQSLSYGFSPGVMPPLPASPYGSGYPAAGAPNLPYPTMGFAAFGGGPGPSTDFGIPNLPPAVPQSLLQGGAASEPDSTCQEIPFQAISVPIAEGMFSPVSLEIRIYSTANHSKSDNNIRTQSVGGCISFVRPSARPRSGPRQQ